MASRRRLWSGRRFTGGSRLRRRRLRTVIWKSARRHPCDPWPSRLHAQEL